MPETRLAKTRAAYADEVDPDTGFTANVIEGEPFPSDAERAPVVEGFDTDRDTGDER